MYISYLSVLQLNLLVKIVMGFFLGLLWISLGFNVMHDASHYALFQEPTYNNCASFLWIYLSIWNHSLWFYHDVLYHHSFTNTIKDPDIYHVMPLCRKHASQKKGLLPAVSYPSIAFTIPGALYGQDLMYLILGTFFGILFVSPIRVPRNNDSVYDFLCPAIRMCLLRDGPMVRDISYYCV